MTKDRLLLFVKILCVWLLSSSLVFCFTTAFEIKINSAVLSLAALIFSAALGSVCALIKSKRKYRISMIVIVFAFVMTVLASLKTVLSQANYAANMLLSVYSEYMSVPNKLSFAEYYTADATALAVFTVFLLVLAFSIFLIRIKLTFPLPIISAALLIPCFLLVNTVPDSRALIAVLSVLFTLFLSSLAQRHAPKHSGVITLVIGAVTACLVICVYNIVPPQSYVRATWQNDMLTEMENLTGIISDNMSGGILDSIRSVGDSLSKTDNLENKGTLTETHTPVMNVKTDGEEKVYLKSTAYANYDGKQWSILSNEQLTDFPDLGEANAFVLPNSGVEHTMEIVTKKKISVLYTPYYSTSLPDSAVFCGDVCVKNNGSADNYKISYSSFNQGLTNHINGEKNYDSYKRFVYDNYLDLPEDSKPALLEIAEENGIDRVEGYVAKVNAVRDFVSSRGVYSLEAETMPSDEEDFAVWFLTDCDSGYCVHYATAAAAMLRALGVPTRYVTGYYFTSEGGKYTTVTSDNAHAWVEYFNDEAGWVPVEATPKSFSPSVYNSGESTSTAPTSATSQGGTSAVTATQPTTAATAATQPTGATSSVGGSGQGSATKQTVAISPAVWIISAIALVVLIILFMIIRYFIITSTRRRSFKNGTTNHQAKSVYRYLEKIRKYSHAPIDSEIEDTAMKAKFSRHRIEKNELEKMLGYAEIYRDNLYKNARIYKRLYYKIILVL